MKFTPEKYSLPDIPMRPFIDVKEIEDFLAGPKPDRQEVVEIIAKSLNKQRLSLQDAAALIKADDPESVAIIKQAAKELKQAVYGNRIVLFAPLYVGNYCMNNCAYCGFRAENKEAVRITLSREQLIHEVEALEDEGQKRLILVFGEHKRYSADFIADTARTVYSVKKGHGEIRRVNINAAPLDIEGFRKVKEAGIGTYQIFQETYHPEMYKFYHLAGPKRDYNYRLTALDRAQEAGLDDVGIGALFGLYDWRFEALALLRHTNHLEACYNVGPHTISFPRMQAASNMVFNKKYEMSDADYARMVAILRLAVPYTGLICTARENAEVRREVMQYGVSQIDGGAKLELGAYSEDTEAPQNLNREQFHVSDSRSLHHVIDSLLDEGYLPSFCTACYRKGRTGEHFMEFSVPGFIKRFCTPNAIFTLAEYLEDYASETQKQKGYKLIENQLQELDGQLAEQIRSTLQRIKQGERDLYQ
ncbi:MAG: [FeFe] hydrogenase H-cluster radical SAM maturase HydG [Bacteroidales bacterium]|nr:[FeFe] hydrogenase H-cluster radical SAM maturase HydG [Bacteroidales bacterium]MCL2133459.1 [FeFe] hydrogenase H-cluster radical SAM maturase HydG [Bacteroidales bacterium]